MVTSSPRNSGDVERQRILTFAGRVHGILRWVGSEGVQRGERARLDIFSHDGNGAQPYDGRSRSGVGGGGARR